MEHSAENAPDHAEQANGDELNNRVFFRLFRTMNVYQRQAQKELKVSAIQGAVLGALSREPDRGWSFSSLVEYLAVSRQNLDAVLKRLERAGYVQRREGESDRRVRMVHLTPAGRAFWRELFPRTLEFYRQSTSAVPIEERALLLETLTKIRQGLRSARLDD